MNRFSSKSAWQKIAALIGEIRSLHITTYAGYASYFMILAIFPTLVLVLGILRDTPLQPEDLMDAKGVGKSKFAAISDLITTGE